MTVLRRALLASAAIGISASSASAATADVRRFNVASQPARTGIPLFAHQAGIQILASQSITDGLTVSGVQGNIEIRTALRQLLSLTDLVPVPVGSSYVLKRRGNAQPSLHAVAAMDTVPQVQGSAGTAAPSVVDQADADPTTAQDQDIIVTGIRGSIQRAQDIKRNAASVVEAVTFEDLGKFSDQNIADSLQRVPGVQIVRNDSGDTGDRASVRGLGSQYLQTTVNGRTLISVGNNGVSPNNLRSFNLDMVPTEVIGGLTLYKTPVAEIVEPGIAGELDISTLRPLAYKSSGKVFGSLSVRGQIDDEAKVLRPRFSGIVGAKLFNDTLGFFVSGVVSNERSQTKTLTLGPYGQGSVFIAGANGTVKEVPNVLLTPGAEFYDNDFTRKRRTVSGGIQWKPDSHWDINGDFTYNKYNNDQYRQHQSLSSNGNALYGTATNPVQAGDVTIDNGVVTGFTTLRNGKPAARYNLDGPRVNRNDTTLKYGGLNVKWHDGPLELSADYGHSDVTYFGQGVTVYGQDIPSNFTFDSSSGLPQFKVNDNLLSIPIHASYWSNY